jgi:hypothetical protein
VLAHSVTGAIWVQEADWTTVEIDVETLPGSLTVVVGPLM